MLNFEKNERANLRPEGLRCTFIFLVFLVTACGGRGATSQPVGLIGAPQPQNSSSQSKTVRSASSLWYRVELSSTQMRVGIRLYAPPDRTKFFLPEIWNDDPNTLNSVLIEAAYGRSGPLRADLDRKRGVIEVDTNNQEWIDLVYSLPIAAQNDLRTLALANIQGAIVAYGPTFLVLPSRETLAASSMIPIEVHAPIDWVVESTWKKVRVTSSRIDSNRQVQGFVVAGAQQLRDSFVIAGESKYLATKRSPDSEVTSVFVGSSFGDQEQRIVHKTIVTTLAEYREQFGDLGPATVLIGQHIGQIPDYIGMGRLGGFVLSIPETDSVDSREAALLIAHEALHLWNGHHLVPDSSEGNRLDWFKEGVTHYLAIKTAFALGHLTLDEAVGELRQIRHSYENNPSVTGIGTPTPSDRRRLPYDLGVRIGLAFDSHLTSHSEQHNLHDWLRLLLRNPNNGEKISLTTNSLRNALRALTTDGNELWEQYVMQREGFPAEGVFRSVLNADFTPHSGNPNPSLNPNDARSHPTYRNLR